MSAYESSDESLDSPDIAIVGMAARVPGASDVFRYWEQLRAGRECIRRLSDEELIAAGVDRSTLHDPTYVKAAAILDDLEQFDAAYFGFSKREATVLDPQHRHFLEVATEALESAGMNPKACAGRVGVFAGAGMQAYMPYHLFTNPELMRSMGLFLVRHTGNDKDFLATRLSYCLDLRGPAVNVQTACSTSLVAVHMACQSLLARECDVALAGGVTIEMPHYRGYHYQEGEILSPDGHCRPFDAASRGTVFGSGAGIVVLKRLRDAVENGDYIHAIVKGTAINNDGARKVGYLAPSVDGQAECIVEALQVAGLNATDISYVECHGTGTPVGDPIEVSALQQAFARSKAAKQSCGIGSVKSNIGHLDTAAGIASLIKVTQMLQHEELVPTLHFEAPNPEIDFANSPFYVVAKNKPWPRGAKPRRAGVSSLGVGGTNAHVILEEAPRRLPGAARVRPDQLLVLSARSQKSLDAYAQRLSAHLKASPKLPLSEVSQTLLTARALQPFCRVLSAESRDEAVALLEGGDKQRVHDLVRAPESPAVIYLFPGGGAQYANMARGVYESEPVFRAAVDECLTILEQREKIQLRDLLFPAKGGEEAATRTLERPSLTLPALLTIEIAYTKLLASWGVEPALMIGHSVGEYAAAYWAGVIDLETALAIVCLRGRLFEKAPEGGMLSVPLSEAELKPYLQAGLTIAVVNTPNLSVVSGSRADLDALEAQLKLREVECKRLHIDVAAHSPLLDPILDEFAQFMRGVKFKAPERPYVSNRSGALIKAEELTAEYFVQHLRQRVRFSECLETALALHPNALVLEVGPGQALTSLLRQHPARKPSHLTLGVSPHAKDSTSDRTHLVTTVGRLFAYGAAFDVAQFLGKPERRVVPLPPTPFEHERHWIEPGKGFFMHADAKGEELVREPNVERWFYAPSFREEAAAARQDTQGERWLVLADEGALAQALIREAKARGAQPVLVTPGERFARVGEGRYQIALSVPKHYEDLWQALVDEGPAPKRILHALCLSGPALDARTTPDGLDRTFYSLLHLGQALAQAELEQGSELLVVSSRAFDVDGTTTLRPLHALAQGPVLVIPKELPELRARLFDLAEPEDAEASARSIIAELCSSSEHAISAERQRRRFVQVLQRVELEQGELALPERPVFLFTGGLGGIARSLAGHFARAMGARVALIARSVLPDRERWPALAQDPSEPHAELLASLLALESDGAELLILSADVGKQADLAAAVRSVLARFGRIDVAVHAAGTLDDGLLSQKTREGTRAVLAPKLEGALHLVEALEGAAPAALILVSSTSAMLGPPGQVDYVAANAHVAALARAAGQRLPKTRVTALGFGIWREVGMAVRARAGTPPRLAGPAGPHPLLATRQAESDGEVVFETVITPERFWVLDEHRVRGGQSVLPGTGSLELIRAAGAAYLAAGSEDVLELKDVLFVSPLEVPDGEHRHVVVAVTRDPARANTANIVISTRGTGSELIENARGTVTRLQRQTAATLEYDKLASRCRKQSVEFQLGQQVLPQDAHLSFGPRWKVARAMHFGETEAVARLELEPRFAADLGSYALHPGVMDIATGFAFSLADGSGADDRVRVPLSYQHVRVYGPLQPKLFSHVRLRRELGTGDMAVFDADIADEHGRVLVHIEGYATKAVSPKALQPVEQRSQAPSLLDRWLPLGIGERDGAEIVERVLAARGHPELYASPVSMFALMEDLRPKARAPATPAAGASASAANASGAPDQPRDDVERKLAEMWQALLGVERVGIRDNFFDLGGHSLIAVRLFSRIKKTYGVDLSLAVLFQAPNIESCAQLIRSQLGLSFDPSAATHAAKEAPKAAAATIEVVDGYTPLVPIQSGAGVPFFCVHGAGGNVLNFRDLAKRLDGQAFYGLQARGVTGGEPLTRIEAMADIYLQAIRSVRPHGPYMLAGYSGGGVVAYEMAQRLRERGEHVALLAFLDTFHPGTKPRAPTLSEHLGRLMEGGAEYLSQKAKAKFARHVSELTNEMKIRFFQSQGVPLPMELRDLHMTRAFYQAAATYVPRRYDGPVTLFRAENTAEVFAHVGRKLGWGDLIPKLEVIEVPGGHESMVIEPNVQVLTGQLKKIIAAALAT